MTPAANGHGPKAMRFPKLRQVDVRPIQERGQAYFLLQDPIGLSEDSLLVPRTLGPVLALCDGSLPDEAAVAAEAIRRYGLPIDQDHVRSLLQTLDQALLLANERSAAALAQVRQRFRQQPFRRPALAGLSYPKDPEELAKHLNGFVSASGSGSSPPVDGEIVGLFSPHIDYPRGGHVYAHGWKQAETAAQEAELVILIGTDHYGNDPFTLTRQNYATPFGVLPTDTSIVDQLADALGQEAAYAGELRHQNEHSIELVAVWLHHMRQGQPVPMVPVLVGSLHGYFDGSNPAKAPHIARFLDVLQSEARARKTLVIASGDLAHVGPAFGGSPLTPRSRQQLAAADAALIRQLCQGSAIGFFDEVRRVRDQNNVCGTTPGFLTLSLLQHLHGTIRGTRLAYDSCPADERNQSAVTIASVAFHR